jgi:hypothetical protein
MTMGNNIRFSSRFRTWSSVIFGVLFLSGIIWLPAQQGPMAVWLLRIHGGAAMVSLILLGTMVPIHMQKGWEQNRNKTTAVVLLTATFALIASGYGLYYCGDDTLRSWISGVHITAGCSFPVVLIWHIFIGRRWNINRFLKPRYVKIVTIRKEIQEMPEELVRN